jgi:murein DD-endopeptidase MepM/ murein hydrolase activator NlpD
MSKRSIYLISPRGTRVRALRVPLWAALAVILMSAAGIAGYFVPFDRLILTEQELAQKETLEERNKRLHSNIGATLKLLSTLRERTARLQADKEQHMDLIGLPQEPLPAAPPRKAPAAAAPSPTVLQRMSESERLIEDFAAAVMTGRHSLFDTIPVSRPVDMSQAIVSRRFGMARDPFTGKQKMHYGVDFAAEIGVPVVASASGVVTRVENDPGWGRRITIAHGRGFRTVYAHLDAVKVAQGRTVRRGEEIGTVGMSGLTTGPHLHYEILHGDVNLDPEEYFFPDWLVAMQD